MRGLRVFLAGLALVSSPTLAADPPSTSLSAADAARIFGARPAVEAISLSPDGTKVAYVAPAAGPASLLFVAPIGGGMAARVSGTDGKPERLAHCDWATNDRLVCSIVGVVDLTVLAGAQRLLALDTNGGNVRLLGQSSPNARDYRQFDGSVLDWLPNEGSGALLMNRAYVPDDHIGSRIGRATGGLGVDRIDTRTLRSIAVEHARENAVDYLSDGSGAVRIMETSDDRNGLLTGTNRYYYRGKSGRDWQPFSTVTTDADGFEHGMVPIALDADRDAAYIRQGNDGRDAIYRVSLDGSMKSELVYAHPQVDVGSLSRIGRRNRVIGVQIVTDRRETVYFDPAYRSLAASLSRALPGLPLITFIDANADESKLLIFAGSDVDPGRYYVYDRTTHQLKEVLLVRPELEHVALGQQRMVQVRAADGTMIPSFLTLPPGSDGRGLPAIVMPHGGPAARDEWEFDWLAQFFASRGFAVLQPNFRGSSGYGNDYYVKNGFKSWRTSIGDVVDAGRWLVSQGIADPHKLAIVGWSYGGYAALQVNVLAPDLFKAVVAIAPVTDLPAMKTDAESYTSSRLVKAYIGSGPELTAGSPAYNAERFVAPVLMFSGDKDINVNVAQARMMDAALRRARKRSELVVYPGLDHYLIDAGVRAQMLGRSDAFLRGALGM